jgi:hypothetical protein
MQMKNNILANCSGKHNVVKQNIYIGEMLFEGIDKSNEKGNNNLQS